jgi:hypothetical protein
VITVHRAPDVLWRLSVGRVVVLPPGAGGPLLLDPAAAEVWLAIEHPMPLTGLVRMLAPAFPGRRTELEDEVADFVAELVARDLVRTTST